VRGSRLAWLVLGGVVVVAVLVVGLVVGTRGDATAVPQAAPAGDREAAAAFSVPALDGGGEVALEDYAGRPVVLNFWASWCPPCRAEMPALDAFAEDNPDVAVLGLAVNDAPEDSRAFAEALEVGFPLGVDRDGSVSIDYGATGLPVTVLIDPRGGVAETWFGEINREQLDDLLDQVDA
jgi:cytochrome c biogenesis protein CcmG/thiol:disulfide interchange protein DsbE